MADRRNARRTKKKAAAAAGGKDRFEDLPDHVLEKLLSFLPSQEAVQTCVLAKRWRHIWKSVPSLRFFTHKFNSDDGINSFVNKLIELRDPTVPLRVCEMVPYDDIESWLQYAASCKVEVLQIDSAHDDDYCRISNNSVISEHLTTLKLYLVEFEFDHSLDLSRCQALKVLDIENCLINLGDISSKSLRSLRIRDSGLYPEIIRTRISAPGLVTCELANCSELTPLFGSLPSVVTAFIKITSESEQDECCDDEGEYCEGFCCQDDYSVILQCLKSATNLELICDSHTMIFSKDLRWRPMFAKLRTVLLNGWCLKDNFTGLIYFLQHSPILERLTLQLSPFLESSSIMVESQIPREQFFVSKNLKVVEIKSDKEHKIQICQIVKLLGTLGVTRETININEDFYYDHSFSFEQKK